MTDISILRNVNQSWLHSWKEALDSLSLDHLYQTCEPATQGGVKPEDAREIVLISPIRSYSHDPEKETIEFLFALGALTRQKPDEVLKAHYTNLDLQIAIHNVLFAPERQLNGSVLGAFSIPLLNFNEQGEPSIIAQQGLEYREGLEWTDGSADGDIVQVWTTEIYVTVNL